MSTWTNILNSLSTSNLSSTTISDLTTLITGQATGQEKALGHLLDLYASAVAKGNTGLEGQIQASILALQNLPSAETVDLSMVWAASTPSELAVAIATAKKDANITE